MIKTGVVEGVVKTASADNENDPIGAAAKCIADAREAVSGLSGVVAGLAAGGKDTKDIKDEHAGE